MEMNSIYSWVKVEVFNEFLDIGVQSLTISNKGELDLVSNYYYATRGRKGIGNYVTICKC